MLNSTARRDASVGPRRALAHLCLAARGVQWISTSATSRAHRTITRAPRAPPTCVSQFLAHNFMATARCGGGAATARPSSARGAFLARLETRAGAQLHSFGDGAALARRAISVASWRVHARWIPAARCHVEVYLAAKGCCRLRPRREGERQTSCAANPPTALRRGAAACARPSSASATAASR